MYEEFSINFTHFPFNSRKYCDTIILRNYLIYSFIFGHPLHAKKKHKIFW